MRYEQFTARSLKASVKAQRRVQVKNRPTTRGKIMTLTAKERRKFADLCRQEADSTAKIIQGMNDLAITAGWASMVKNKSAELLAFVKVAEVLENLITVTIENRG